MNYLFIFFLVIIQLLVASALSKDLIYYTFNDKNSTDAFRIILESIKKNEMTVQTVYNHLINFCDKTTNMKLKFKHQFTICDYFSNL